MKRAQRSVHGRGWDRTRPTGDALETVRTEFSGDLQSAERAWAFEYVKALRELAPSKGFDYVDAKPLRSPQVAEKAASYLSKYLAKRNADGSFEVTETVKATGRSLLNYLSRRLTAKSGVTMRVLRNVRIAWAWPEGFLPDDVLDGFELLFALCLLEQRSAPTRGP